MVINEDKIMRKSYLFRCLFLVVIVVLTISCNTKKNKSSNPSAFMMAAEVLSDSSATWKSVKDVTLPLCDSLCKAITNENNLESRLAGQEMAYVIIDAVTDSYLAHSNAGEVIPTQELYDITIPLQNALNQWFYADDEQLPHIWKDLFYVSHKESDNPLGGYFHLMISLPTEEQPEPEFYVFYPESAAGRPAFVFKEKAEEVINADDELVYPVEVYLKNELNDGSTMYAKAGADVVQKLLSSPSMFILFESEEIAGHPSGEIEIASLQLEPMWSLWNKLVE